MKEGNEPLEEYDTSSKPCGPTCAQPDFTSEDAVMGKAPPSPCSPRSVAQQKTEPGGEVTTTRERRNHARASVSSLFSVESQTFCGQLLDKMKKKVFEFNKELDDLEEELERDEREGDDKFNHNIFGQLCRSKRFEMLSIGIVCLNAVWMGYTTDLEARFIQPNNMYIGDALVPAVENLFSIFFVFEIMAKTFGVASLIKELLDVSYLFDFVLVALMISDTWVVPFVGSSPLGNLQLLRLLRLLRITRMAKLMKAFPELIILIRGIRKATRAVIWDLILLLLVTYTWAILMTNEYHAGPVEQPIDEFFGSMSNSLFTLLLMGTILDDITRCTDAIRATGNYWMLGLFVLYVTINSFTLLNMLVGVLAGVVSDTTDREKRNIEEDALRRNVQRACKRLDKDKGGFVAAKDYKSYGLIPKGLEDLDFDYSQYIELGEILFDKHPINLPIDKLMFELLRLQPKNDIGVLDMKSFQADVEKILKMETSRVRKVDEDCERLLKSLTSSAPPGADRIDVTTNQNFPDQALDEEQVIRALGPVSFFDIVSELQHRFEVPTVQKTRVPKSWLVRDEIEPSASGSQER